MSVNNIIECAKHGCAFKACNHISILSMCLGSVSINFHSRDGSAVAQKGPTLAFISTPPQP